MFSKLHMTSLRVMPSMKCYEQVMSCLKHHQSAPPLLQSVITITNNNTIKLCCREVAVSLKFKHIYQVLIVRFPVISVADTPKRHWPFSI